MADLSFHCVATPRCVTKRQCAGFDNCPSRGDPFPSAQELFAAFMKGQENPNIYAYGPAQFGAGLRNVYLLALQQNGSCAKCGGTGWLHGAQEWTPQRMRKGTPYKSIRCDCKKSD